MITRLETISAPLRRAKTLPAQCDPWRRLLAAIALRAVWDVHLPGPRLAARDYDSARAFLKDQQIKGLLEDMGIWLPWSKVRRLIELTEE